MHTLLHPILVVMLACGMTSCSALKKLKKKPAPTAEQVEPEKPKPQRVGVIGLVHPDYGFVLIQTSKGFSLPEGTQLTCFSANGLQTALLKSTPARQGNYITADITSGTPEKDNVVVYDPEGTLTPPSTAPSATGVPAVPSTPPLSSSLAPSGATVSASPAGSTLTGTVPAQPPLDSLLPKEAPPLVDPTLRPVPTVPLGQ
jgi:hypothetical protein